MLLKIKILLVLLLFPTLMLFAQKAEKIYSIVKVKNDHSYFIQQAEAWWNLLQKDLSDEDAWMNFYLANRYERLTRKDDYQDSNDDQFIKTDSVIDILLHKYIPETFTEHYILWRKGGFTSDQSKHLLKAYQINPDYPGIDTEMLTYYESVRDLKKRKLHNNRIDPSEMSYGMLNYAYNMLITAKPGAIIFTHGDNDTYPLWYLQDVHEIRQDVHVMNISLIFLPGYRDLFLKELDIPSLSDDSLFSGKDNPQTLFLEYITSVASDKYDLYISLTVWKKYFSKIEDNLYLVGVLLRYSEENIDNVALLKRNFFNLYHLDYLAISIVPDMSRELVNMINMNYLPGLIKLYEHFTVSGDKSGAQWVDDQAMFIINESGNKNWKETAKKIFNCEE